MIGLKLSYSERANDCHSQLGASLLKLLDDKKTNLAFSADVSSSQSLLELADRLGPHICLLKTHIDIIEDFTPTLIIELQKLAREHHFLLFEDRKFADIGHTVQQQYAKGLYHIADWADVVTVHSLPGPGIIQGLAEIGRPKNRGIFLLAEMSSAGHLLSKEYAHRTLKMAEQFPDFVLGFITQHALSSDPSWINLTPGVKLNANGDTLGQQYITPEQALAQNGSDIIIVGRGIIKSKDPLAEAQQYREKGWTAYLRRCS